jgi:Kef-type K+ transport system membrane component KefB
MVGEVLLNTSLIIGIAALITILAKLVKQPPIVAYLISGIVVGPLALNLINPTSASTELISTFSQIGVALLLFIIGLNLDPRILKELGKVSILAGVGQVILTTMIGFLIVTGLGFESLSALYLAVALAFSSTVVAVKLLSDKNEMSTLHGKIALGILIVQDLAAALALLILPLIKTISFNLILLQIGKIIGLIALIFIFSSYLLNKYFLHHLAKDQEILFLFGISWALIISLLFDSIGLSLEIGALIAGMTLASSKYTLELSGKIRPLRDFFIVLFFVFFGSQLVGPLTGQMVGQAVILSLFILIGNPLIIMGIMRVLGYRKRTNFLTGISLAQISEFSLILILLGFNLGHLPQEIMNLTVLIAIITIFISSYMIHHSHTVFNKISNLLNLFEGNRIELEKSPGEVYDIILFGHNRIGYDLLKTLRSLKEDFIVVDYDPAVIKKLTKQKINCVYGDASDKEFVNELNLDKAKLIISTITDVTSNLTIKKRLNEVKSKATFIATAEQPSEAFRLYESEIDYVLLPHILGGKYASKLIENHKTNKEKYKLAGKRQREELKKRFSD